jgi:pimeloyl-ACP methyl ester carboxylesterase
MTDNQPLPAFKSPEGRARFLAAYDAALAQWPVAYEVLEVPTRLGLTQLVASGPPDGAPLLLLPSFAGTATVWRLNVEALSRRYRTFAIDVIGQPGKSLAERPLKDRRDYADWLSDLMDGLGVARASMVGCSFGGFLALSQAVMAPQRVDKVVAISPVGVFGSQYWKLIWAMRVRAPLRRLRRRLGGKAPAPSMTDLVRRPPRDGLWGALMAVTMAETPQVSVINASAFDRRELKAIRAPVLLLIGEHETLYAPAATLALARSRVRGLTGAVVADADHIAAMAQPDDVDGRILAFLGGD